MENLGDKEKYTFNHLVEIMKLLRSDNGCPWDKEQTHKSIERNFIEEVYEAVEAIEEDDNALLKEELGDVLLQIVFHSEIASGDGVFDINDVTDGICRKLIMRHPHIFSDVVASDSSMVLKNWDEIKRAEKGQNTHTQTLSAVSKYLPALIKSEKIQKRAAKVGFDWDSYEGALLKLKEEVVELERAAVLGDRDNIDEESGDVLFAAVNVARLLGVDPEGALSRCCDKFIIRFEYIENNSVKTFGKQIDELTLEQMDKLWEESKRVR